MNKNIQERYINEQGILVTVYKPGPVRKFVTRSKHLGMSDSHISRTTGKHR